MKYLKFIGVVLGLGIAFLIGQKIYLTYKYNSYVPQIETKESILKFLKETMVIDPNSVYRIKDTLMMSEMDNLFGPNKIYIFDKNGTVLDNNIKKEQGTCYADLAKKMCSGVDLKNSKFNSLIANRFQTLKQNIEPLIENEKRFEDYEYIIVFGWAKYFPESCDAEALKFLDCLKSNYQSVHVVALNFDYYED